jgi:DNA ligase-1
MGLIPAAMLADAAGTARLVFPLGATPKIDGIRALTVGGRLVSRTLKPIPNRLLRDALESVLPDGADGELLAGATFQDCTSRVMSANHVPPRARS